MNVIPPRVIGFTVVAVISVFLLFNIASRSPSVSSPRLPSSWLHRASKPGDVLAPTSNATLGFQKILVLNMPERTDKRDSMSLAASLTGLKVEYTDGVRGETILNKALPVGQEERLLSNTTLGSWRGHMNAIRLAVEQNLGSVLIVEDDADWDIRIRSQLADLAKGSRWLMGNDPNTQTQSPYGDGWDIMWVGNCHDAIPADDARVYVIENDPSVPLVKNLNMNNPIMLEPYPPHSRIVHMASAPICTYAYALTQAGARKVLHALSVKELTGIFDNALADFCQYRKDIAKCIAVNPSYIYGHRFAGKAGKGSDINKDSAPVKKAHTPNIRWSTKLNTEKLLLGQTDYHDSYPDEGPTDPIT